MKVKFLFVFTFLILSVLGCGGGGGGDGNSKMSTRWLVMVYMAGDNDLTGQVSADLSEMKEVGSNNDITIVVQADTKEGGVKRLLVRRNEAVVLDELGELDMSDPVVLKGFLLWAIDNFPAERRFLILWDHGTGIRKELTRDVLWDTNNDTSSNWMDVITLAKALKSVVSEKGKFDIIGIDACLMGMVEVAYELRDCGYYFIASENTEPWEGWPYESVLQAIHDNISNTTMDVALAVAKSYVDYYSNGYYGTGITMSVVDLEKMDDFANVVSTFVAQLTNGTCNYCSLLGEVQRLDENNDQNLDTGDAYADLLDFVKVVNNNCTSVDAVSSVESIWGSVVVYHGFHGEGVNRTYGLGVWLPVERSDYEQQLAFYNGTQWSNSVSWSELISRCFNSTGGL